MTFCSQCGEQAQDDAAFCTGCGASLALPDATTSAEPEQEAVDAAPAAAPIPPPDTAPTSTTEASPKNTRLMLAGGIAAVAIAVIAGIAIVAMQQGDSDSGGVAIAAASTTSTSESATPAAASSTTTPSTTTTTAAATTTTTTLPPTTTTTLPAELVAGLETTGVYVVAGSESNSASLENSVKMARTNDWDLSVISVAAEPEEGLSPFAASIAASMSLGTVVVVAPEGLGWASQEPQFYDGEFERAWGLIPASAGPDRAVRNFVKSVLGGPDSVGAMKSDSANWLLLHFDGTQTEPSFGEPDDVALMGDWDCDGIATPGVWRQSTYRFFLSDESSATDDDSSVFIYNNDNVLPLTGDFDGDGCDTVAFYHRDDREFRIYNVPLSDYADFFADNEDAEGIPEASEFYFGATGDVPFVGDFDGDGIDTIGVFRPSNATVYLKNSFDGGKADAEFTYGAKGDVPVAGDWGAEDGIDTVGVYRPDVGNFYLRYENAAGPADETISLGMVDAIPVVGAFGLDRSG